MIYLPVDHASMFPFQFESDLFWLTKPVTLSAQEKTNFEINFEPDTLGTIQSRLILRSSTVGEYM